MARQPGFTACTKCGREYRITYVDASKPVSGRFVCECGRELAAWTKSMTWLSYVPAKPGNPSEDD